MITRTLEIEREVESPGDLQRVVEKAMDVLRLGLLKPVGYQSYRMHGDFMSQIVIFVGTLTPGAQRSTAPPLPLSENDIRLQAFWDVLAGKLPDPHAKPSGPLEIAFNRFRRAMVESVPIEQQLLYSVMGMEALLLEGGAAAELRFRLSSRTALLMGLLGHDAQLVSKLVKRAYDLRSQYVHGSAFDDKETHEAQDLVSAMLRYLRDSLTVYLMSPLAKDALIQELDRILIGGDRAHVVSLLTDTKNLCALSAPAE